MILQSDNQLYFIYIFIVICCVIQITFITKQNYYVPLVPLPSKIGSFIAFTMLNGGGGGGGVGEDVCEGGGGVGEDVCGGGGGGGGVDG